MRENRSRSQRRQKVRTRANPRLEFRDPGRHGSSRHRPKAGNRIPAPSKGNRTKKKWHHRRERKKSNRQPKIFRSRRLRKRRQRSGGRSSRRHGRSQRPGRVAEPSAGGKLTANAPTRLMDRTPTGPRNSRRRLVARPAL